MLQLGVSNLAWSDDKSEKYFELLKKLNIKYLEIAPTKIWNEISAIKEKECNHYVEKIAKYDLVLISAQSIFYGRDDLNIYYNFNKVKEYFKVVLKVIRWLKISKIVFGSPKTRNYPKNADRKKLRNETFKYFDELANIARQENIVLCLEPNSSDYKSNFLTTTIDTSEFINTLKNSNLKLNLDLSTMILNNENINKHVIIVKNNISHVHVSAPFLGNVLKFKNEVGEYISCLKKNGYSGQVILEMLESQDDRSNYQSVNEAIEFLMKVSYD